MSSGSNASIGSDPQVPPTSATNRGWKIAAVVAVIVLAFVAGLYFPRSWLPGDFATHLPSSCASTIARAREISSSNAAALGNRRATEEFLQLVDDRPDCFTAEEREILNQ